ncbi:MAG TPA: alpha/beta hydrolase [Roseiflexaceae bacterium]|nr:alpha/beta hydrolase [Roseiflexaceae bacterium]
MQAGRGDRLVLLLHGFPECWYSWRYQLPVLAQHATVVAPDLRGYNETEKPRSGYTLDVLTRDIDALIEALGYRQAVVVGHDWGGMLAWALAIAFPERVERLAVLNIPHPALFSRAIGRNWRQTLRSWYIGLFQLPWLPEWLLRWHDCLPIAQMIRGAAVDRSRFGMAELHFYRQAAARPGALTAMLNYYRGMRQGSRGLFHGTGMRVKAPTHMIWAENDVALGKELTYGTERFVDDFRITYIPHCGHFVQQEQPEQVNRLLLDFLQGG